LIKNRESHKFLRNLNSQAAMEFLMTYGWAIIVVLVSIAALAYFGVLKQDMFTPAKCSLPTGITCVDFSVETSRVILVLQNNFGVDITIDAVDVAKKGGSSCSNIDSIQVKNNQKALITVSDCNNGNIKERFKGDVSITYTKESLLSHSMQGSIVARIAEGTTTASSSICQNAEDDDLCNVLDIVYGVGYKAACCSDHSLCCS